MEIHLKKGGGLDVVWCWNRKFQFFMIEIYFVSCYQMFYYVSFPMKRSSAEVTAILHSRSLQ